MIELDLQMAGTNAEFVPSLAQWRTWLSVISPLLSQPTEMTIRVVDHEESKLLNYQYRQKNKPTNVLSFPFEAPANIPIALLGDLIICHQVVNQEAIDQQKSYEAHWAHMGIHGTLHLLGYDHIDDTDAITMESLEIQLLKELNFPNPYVEFE